MFKPTVVISGAGIAGPVCAFFLARAGIKTTIIERSPSMRTTGQQIDVRGAGLEVVQRMGLLDAIKSRTTQEAGLAFVNEKGRRVAEFPVRKDGGRSLTAEIEILRGEMADVFYGATKSLEEVNYVFGDHVVEIVERGSKVEVVLEKGGRKEYDYVIGADGQGSKTRRLAFKGVQDVIKPLHQYVAYFTIPKMESERHFAEWYNATGGRAILLRPDNAGYTRAYLTVTRDPLPELLKGHFKLSVAEQKQKMHEMFSDAGWEAKEVLAGMDKSEDFYMQEIVQVKMSSWSQGRVVLLGDAGYCPSPISGMGTSCAIVGAYLLAGEIAKHGMDYEKAFLGYEEKLRPYVTKAQKLPPGAPGIINPQTQWGIAILRGLVGVVSRSGVTKLFDMLSAPQGQDERLTEYEFKREE
ncbi:related to salicylate 1-monooxygenase [Rhynchosporium graminicola]|uniref:Related to salicylate 1-monooxygenase n=1 Tax=Rhynchosporium graminicola TaxID=2792576 RepID=A0A1E1LCB1_9HELO|nr:related to salicylate 1-monooxygenase [Rhynchosporium commune]